MNNKFYFISGGIMAFIYAACGVFLLILDTPYFILPDSYKTILGLAMISYAAFRIFRLYKNYINTEKDDDENKIV